MKFGLLAPLLKKNARQWKVALYLGANSQDAGQFPLKRRGFLRVETRSFLLQQDMVAFLQTASFFNKGDVLNMLCV